MPETDAAVAIVYAREPEEAVLLMRRAERPEDSWSGHWSFPGGRCDPKDLDSLQTAVRELEEECGIRLGPDDLETAMPPRLARRAVGPYLLVAPFVFLAPSHLGVILDTGEAVEAVWLPLAIVRDRSRHCLQAVPGRPAGMYFPAIMLNRAPLWGFTYRLLLDWLGIVPPQADAGLAAANELLRFVCSLGASLREPWHSHEGVQECVIEGKLPDSAIAQFCSPGSYIDTLNLIEVRQASLRLVGPRFEEYVLHVVP